MNLKQTMIAASLVGATASLAFGALPPGYVWGIANCGPAVNNSAAACHLCCAAAQRDGTINSIERDGCDQLCDEAVFTRTTFWDQFWDGYRPFWF